MNNKKAILVVDDEDDFTQLMEEILIKNDYDAHKAFSGFEALQKLNSEKIDLVILDIVMPEIDGLSILKQISQMESRVPVIVLTGDSRIETVVDAMKLGAYDYFSKPIDWNKLEIAMKNALFTKKLEGEVIRLRSQIESQNKFENIVGGGPKMIEIRERAERALESDAIIYLCGEKGGGKEHIARTIHAHSSRSNAPFITISCSAIPESLIEYELFGYEQGVLSKGMSTRSGKIEHVNGGTLYLDDIDVLPAAVQVRLLELLERGSFHRIGGNENIKVDFRLMVASTKDLENEVSQGNFREDLYYRVNIFPILVWPLREHIEDIPELVEHYRIYFNEKNGTNIQKVDNEVLSYFMKYDWPGNVQELENVMERSMLNTRGDTFKPDDLPITITSFQVEMTQNIRQISLQQYIEQTDNIPPLKELEKMFLVQALKLNKFNLSNTASQLGIGRTTLYRKLQRYRIKVDKTTVD